MVSVDNADTYSIIRAYKRDKRGNRMKFKILVDGFDISGRVYDTLQEAEVALVRAQRSAQYSAWIVEIEE